MASTALPNYTKVDTNGKEVVYWVAKGECEHITLFEVQSFKDDYIFCMGCNAPTQVVTVKHMRPARFVELYGGKLNT